MVMKTENRGAIEMAEPREIHILLKALHFGLRVC